MKRKLIKQGGSGLTFYLPKKWATERGLGPGDEISLKEFGDYLLLSSQEHGKRETTITINEDNENIYSPNITSCYRLGYEKIKVISDKEIVLKHIVEKALPLLLGFEVTSKSSNELVLENIGEPSDEKFDTVMKRIFIVITELGEQIKNALEQNKKIPDFSIQAIQLRKFIFFGKRILTKKIGAVSTPYAFWELLTYQIAIGHGYLYLADYIRKNKVSVGKKSLEYLKRANDYFEMLYDAFLNKDNSKIEKMRALRDEMSFSIPENLLEEGKENAVVIAKIGYIARITQLCSGSIYYLIVG